MMKLVTIIIFLLVATEANSQQSSENKATEGAQFKESPWYNNNPATRIGTSVGKMFYSVGRLDRVGKKRYWVDLGKNSKLALVHTVGVIGDTVGDIARVVKAKEAKEQGLIPNPEVLQCTSFIPLGKGGQVAGALLQMDHAWVQVGEKSYGTSFFFAGKSKGPAGIGSPDRYVDREKITSATCTAVYQPQDMPPSEYKKNFECISENLSIAKNIEEQDASNLEFDYSFLKRNCGMAANFLIECSGGKPSQVLNANIGAGVDWKTNVNLINRDPTFSPFREEIIKQIDSVLEEMGRPFGKAETKPKIEIINRAALSTIVDGIKQLNAEKKMKKTETHTEIFKNVESFEELLKNIKKDKDFKSYAQNLKKLRNDVLLDFDEFKSSTLLEACNQTRAACKLSPIVVPNANKNEDGKNKSAPAVN